jgi:hypothetical protein
MSMPSIDTEDTSIRSACPFCHGVYVLRGCHIEHTWPECDKFSHQNGTEYLREVRRAELQNVQAK